MQAYTQKIIQRLDKLNQQRVERALALMDIPSQRVFHLIPTLLHFNHPVLPGYCDANVPFGIRNFELNESQIQFVEDTQLTHQLDGLEKLQGTYPFTLERSHKAYRLNLFLRNLSDPLHRERFLSEKEELMTECQLTKEEKDMVRELKWIEMIQYGAIFFGLEK
mgnify:CR=1 FL=1